MKIGLVTHGTFLDPARIASGNSVRAYYLALGLAEQGHEVVHYAPASLARHAGEGIAFPPGIRAEPFLDGPDLRARLARERVEAVLVGYWELLDHFPEGYPLPVIADLVAPRILEGLFEDRDLSVEAARMVRLYRRADLFLAGNERQRHFLLPWLILAGFRCALRAPVAVVPISTRLADRPARAWDGEWRLVAGGVAWPWRRTQAYLEPLVAGLEAGPARLELFSGGYLYGATAGRSEAARAPSARVAVREFLPYGAMQDFLATGCDVGVELEELNLEREFSQSFRSTEFLGQGLPLLCCRYTELASWVERYDAGWLVDDPAGVPAALRELCSSRERWAAKARNARRLVEERLDYRVTIRPVLDFLRQPERPARWPGPLLARPGRLSRAGSGDEVDRSERVSLRRRLRRAAAAALRALLPTRPGAVLIAAPGQAVPDEAPAAALERLARGLSPARELCLITEDAGRYHRRVGGAWRARRFPWVLRLLGPRRDRVRTRLLALGLPAGAVQAYRPGVDWGCTLRTLWLALRHGPRRFLAVHPASAWPCLRSRRLLGGAVVLSASAVEFQRLAEPPGALSPDGQAWLRELELRACRRVEAVLATSEPVRRALLRDGVSPDQVRVGAEDEADGRERAFAQLEAAAAPASATGAPQDAATLR